MELFDIACFIIIVCSSIGIVITCFVEYYIATKENKELIEEIVIIKRALKTETELHNITKKRYEQAFKELQHLKKR